jgi:hypothetical protein
MASQVLSGASNPSYTNNTGQNVRIVINFMAAVVTTLNRGVNFGGSLVSGDEGSETLTINWAGVSQSYNFTWNSSRPILRPAAIGRNLASFSAQTVSRNSETFQGLSGAAGLSGGGKTTEPAPVSVTMAFAGNNATCTSNLSLPTELMLAPGQRFSATCGVYNIVVIPEAG